MAGAKRAGDRDDASLSDDASFSSTAQQFGYTHTCIRPTGTNIAVDICEKQGLPFKSTEHALLVAALGEALKLLAVPLGEHIVKQCRLHDEDGDACLRRIPNELTLQEYVNRALAELAIENTQITCKTDENEHQVTRFGMEFCGLSYTVQVQGESGGKHHRDEWAATETGTGIDLQVEVIGLDWKENRVTLATGGIELKLTDTSDAHERQQCIRMATCTVGLWQAYAIRASPSPNKHTHSLAPLPRRAGAVGC